MGRAEQLADDISARIESGTLEPGAQLPTMAEMARLTGHGGTTVQSAYRILKDRGLIVSIHGQGSFVAQPKAVRTHSSGSFYGRLKVIAGAADPAAEAELAARIDSDEPTDLEATFLQTPATAEQAEAFGIEEGDLLAERIYQRRVGDVLAHVVTSWIPLSFANANPDLVREDLVPWPGGIVQQLATIGREALTLEESIVARQPTVAEIQGMELDGGVVILEVTSRLTDVEGQVVELAEWLFPSDRTQLAYSTRLPRW